MATKLSVLGSADVLTPDVEAALGLGYDVSAHIHPSTRCVDVSPWLLDCVAFKIACLGHQDSFPQAWDWEHLLSMLEPDEEVLYVLDYSPGRG